MTPVMDPAPEPADASAPRWEDSAELLIAPLLSPTIPPMAHSQRSQLRDRVVASRFSAAASASAAARPIPLRARRYRPVAWAAGLSVAAGLAFALLPRGEDSSLDTASIQFEVDISQALERAPRGEPGGPLVVSLRNQPGWTVRLPPGSATDGLGLYLAAAGPGSELNLLEAAVEHQHAAFRIVGEVGELGLIPGETTLYFLLGPANADSAALQAAEAAAAGRSLPAGWAVETRQYRIVE